jgi:hypothetical protein
MGLKGIVRTGQQGFKKVVWENVVDTLPGGLVLDIDPADYPDGYVPEGTMVGKDPATGFGKALTVTNGSVKPLGYTLGASPAEANCTVGVGISGTIREAALPTGQGTASARATALPRITHV